MATYKRIDGDYAITTLNSADNVTITTHTLEVVGNLDVSGNLTYINVTELNIQDPFILLNASNTGSYASNSGVLTHTSVSTFAGIRYNATATQWEISSSTDTTGLSGTWSAIATGNATVGGANTQVQFNDGGSFGATANLTFDKSINQLTITTGSQSLGNIGSAPAAVANSAVLYNLAPDLGASGVYARTSSTQDELITAVRARLFSIIF